MKIRSLHPEFFTDSKIHQLTWPARILYQGLWCRSDDEGRGQYLPKAIEGDVFPLETVDIVGLLGELVRSGVIRLYEVSGDVFYEIPAWNAWQKPRYKSTRLHPKPNGYLPVSHPQTGFWQNTGETLPDIGPDPARFSGKQARGVGDGVGDGEGAAAVGDGFDVFHRKRAAAEYQKRGRPATRNQAAYLKTIIDDPDFRVESERVWAHLACVKCDGTGLRRWYSPGSGYTESNCEGE